MKKINLENDKKIETGFTIPEHYFDSFEDKLMQKIDVIAEQPKTIKLWPQNKLWVSGIAAALLITLGTWWFFEQKTIENIELSQDYLAYENDITAEEIAKHLTNEDITKLEAELTDIDTQTENYINNYLN